MCFILVRCLGLSSPFLLSVLSNHQQLFHGGIFGLREEGVDIGCVSERHGQTDEVGEGDEGFLLKPHDVCQRHARLLRHCLARHIALYAATAEVVGDVACNVVGIRHCEVVEK